MSEPTPNERQQELIDGTEGLYLVDAGPGTGKTFAITRRYAAIVDQPRVDPEDVLLATFTRGAATEMKERIVEHSSYALRELADAPIQTFHSLSHDVLSEHGYDAPAHLGLEAPITDSIQILEDDLVAARRFREFFSRFQSQHPEYAPFYRVIGGPGEIQDLIEELAAKGIAPTVEGWYQDGKAHLEGDFDAFKAQFDARNQPRNDGGKQSPLRDALSRFGKRKTYRSDAPSKTELRGPRGTKQLEAEIAERVFHEDRADLTAFVHDAYVEYLQFALQRNYLTFGFLQLFAFVLLRENPRVREAVETEYVIVDEFQDTSEIQFKLALLASATDNLCAVGDWKQSIYSFQYADVENIQAFEERLESFSADLNDDARRVAIDPETLTRIELEENYRSTQSLIDFSEQAITTPARQGETVDPPSRELVELDSNAAFDNTTIEGVTSPDEHEAVLETIQTIVGNDEYAVEGEDGQPRTPTHGDIAVFTRTRDYGRELLAVAEEYGVPMAYDGGIELYRTDPAKLLLAWLRILASDADRGWAVVLEQAGYTLDEIDHLLETERYPDDLADFRDDLAELEAVGAVARRVFDRYGFSGETADALLHTLQSLYETTTVTPGEVIQLIEAGIETGSTVDVHTNAGEDSVTVQTIHAAKGLEYPIVLMANMNDGRFPPQTRDRAVIQYQDPVGLRQRKIDAEDHGVPHVYDNWRFDVLRQCLDRNLDEERRLLYVGITRAESHLVFVGGEEPNTFLEELSVAVESVDPTVEPSSATGHVATELPFTVPVPEGPVGETPHSLMDESVFEGDSEGTREGSDPVHSTGGIDVGEEAHEFAEAYARGEAITPDGPHQERIASFLDGLSGTLHVEQPATLPLEVDGKRVSISGVIDLVHETEDRVEIVDYKTDSTRRAEAEYRKQLSVYAQVLEAWVPEKAVTASILYTSSGERVRIEPLSRDELRALVRADGEFAGAGSAVENA